MRHACMPRVCPPCSQKTAEKADDTQRRQNLHQMGVEYLLLARGDPHHYRQGEGVDHGYQCHHQQCVIEHRGQATR